MHNILFASQDPGGTNVLIPIIRNVKDQCNINVWAKDSAVSIYRNREIDFVNIEEKIKDCNRESLKDLLKENKPELVITGTCVTDFFERNLWMAARELGIQSVAILDSWCNYGLRFSEYTFKDCNLYRPGNEPIYYPDRIFVMDDYTKSQMEKEGINPDWIDVVGQPFLQSLRELYKSVGKTEINKYKKRVLGDDKKKVIVFVSDHLSDSFVPSGIEYWGYDEQAIFECLYEAINKCNFKKEKYAIIIRPHPKEKKGKWDNIVKIYHTKGLQIEIDDATTEELVIASSDIVVGMWSIMLIEAVLAEKRILSVQVGAKRKAEFMLSDQGFLNPIYNMEELQNSMQAYFDGVGNIGKVKWNAYENSVDMISVKLLDFLRN